MTYAVRAEGLRKRYGAVTALDGVDLEVSQGTVLGLLGPNGAGKTTTIRILSTLLRPDSGRASVGGFDVVRQADQVRRLIALTGQYAALDEHLTGAENLELFGKLLELGKREARRRAAGLLADFGLEEAADRPAKTYSGGMRRRLDLAAGLVGRPSVLFLDEPTTGLDPESRLALWQAVRRLVTEGMTVVLTTQYMEEADQLADDLVVVAGGAVAARGTAAALKAKVGDRTLVLRPERPGKLNELLVAAAQAAPAARTEGEERVVIPSADGALMNAVLDRVTEAGLTLDEAEFRRPSLDEVFLAVVGRTVGQAQQDTEATRRDTEPEVDAA
ncbi:ATP-binding cassette domain-containing protein [Streptomyces sp. SID11385]|uniref:ATP-binding cassette domain-containing protein n=1 Tax=Streptomyces sp. SID11385 TaxID=2706031 RepID=UPI0013CA2D98|nr:ATP-binding cassette domain-containing protein [Streptomyces sp. SID11385]NEA44221.1 ATP-binding cassette domain-containing protein [Streptomyces sp. SID11385]